MLHNMLLTVLDRLMLLNILPKEGDFRTLKVIHDLKYNKIAFTSAELERLQFTPVGDQTKWNYLEPIGVIFDKVEINIIANILIKLDKENKLSIDCVHLYELFIEEVTIYGLERAK